MPDLPLSRVDTPLDRLVVAVQAWDKIPPMPQPAWRPGADSDQATLERAKGAVMFRYGVNSHVAFAMIARWSRSAEVPIPALASALVQGTVENDWLLDSD